MNNSKIWLVVHPTVGVPIFLGAVAVGSFAVHVAVLSNTTWVADFLSGNELGGGEETATLIEDDPIDPAKVALTTDGGEGFRQVMVELEDGTRVPALIETTAYVPPDPASKSTVDH